MRPAGHTSRSVSRGARKSGTGLFPYMSTNAKLLALLRNRYGIYIQTHDFPDHDSVASAFGLQVLLKSQGIESHITYEGDIQRESLQQMIDELGIDIRHNEEYGIGPDDGIIIVDGCKGNRNVSNLLAPELAVLDHHVVDNPEDIPYVDLRPDYGACATIVYTYFKDLGVEIPEEVATALLIGVSMDTALLTRAASPMDLEAYSHLYPRARTQLVNEVICSYMQKRDLEYYRQALDNVVIRNRFAFCYLPQGCSKNLMGILADFFMSLRDVDFVGLCARNDHAINFSVRCNPEKWNASLVIQKVLRGIGFGGGHIHMAGGTIKDPALFDVDAIYRRFCEAQRIPLPPSSPPLKKPISSYQIG